MQGGTKPKPLAELKSPWAIHVRQWMLANPGVKYREAQTQAKASYAKVGKPAPKPRAAPKPKAAPRPEAAARLEPWRAHVTAHRAENPGLSLKAALQEAKVTYRTPTRPVVREEPLEDLTKLTQEEENKRRKEIWERTKSQYKGRGQKGGGLFGDGFDDTMETPGVPEFNSAPAMLNDPWEQGGGGCRPHVMASRPTMIASGGARSCGCGRSGKRGMRACRHETMKCREACCVY